MFPQNTRTIRSGVLRALVLALWILGTPGLRPAFHYHPTGSITSSERTQLADHLKTYAHSETEDTEKLHLHWLVVLDGCPAPAFPNCPPALEVSQALPSLETELSISSGSHGSDNGFDFSIDLPLLLTPRFRSLSNLASIDSLNLDRLGVSNTPKHSRFSAYITTLYSAAYL